VAAVEAVSAAGAAGGVTIDLHNQTEAFVITGSAFNDTLIGTAAADTLNAGGGSNTMTGGKGADTFVFTTDFISGTITDFAAGSAVGHDTLNIVFPGIDWNSLIADNAMHQVGADTVIDLGAHGSITLKNVAKTALTVDDFKFV
jgi:Ca2+-binding RTX toxin-like protein